MEHEHARRLLSDGRSDDALDEHLRVCADCRTYADALDTVLHAAPALVPAAPPDLRDRLLRTVAGVTTAGGAAGAAGARGEGVVVPLPRRSWGRWLGAPAAVAAAAVAAVVLTGQPPGQGDPGAVLVASVSRVRGVGATSFAFDVSGHSELRLPEIRLDAEIGLDGSVGVAPSPPVLPGLPPLPGRPPMPGPPPPPPPSRPPHGSSPAPEDGAAVGPLPFPLPTFAVPELPVVELPTLEPGDLELLSELTFPRLCELLGGACSTSPGDALASVGDYVDGLVGLLPELPAGDRRLLAHRVHLGLELDRLGADVETRIGVHERIGVDGLELRFDGSGRSDGEHASSYALDWQVVRPVAAAGSLEVVTRDGRTWVRTAGSERWLVSPEAAAFHLGPGTAPHDLDDVLARLASPASPPRDVGTTTLRGVQVRGLVVAEGHTLTTVWVGIEDGLVHRVASEHRSGAADAVQLVATTVFDLYDHGLDVEVVVPDAGEPLESAPLTALPPFWVDLTGRLSGAP